MMASTMVECNNNNDQNGSTVIDPEPQQARGSRDGSAKEPVRNETDEFDVSDCFTNDFDDVTGGGMIGSKKNGSYVNIEASQEGAPQVGVSCLKKEPPDDVVSLSSEEKIEKKVEVVLPKIENPPKKVPEAATIVLDTSDDEDDSQDSTDTRVRRSLARASLLTKKEDENEDPDIVRLKKDLYQNTGEIDYDLDLGEDEKPPVEMKLEPKVELKTEEQPMVVINAKSTPSPVKPNLERLKINTKPIPTIDLTSSDEEIVLPKKEKPETEITKTEKEHPATHPRKAKNSVSNTSVCSEYVVVKAEEDKLRIRKKKHKSKKRSKRRKSLSEGELIEDTSPVDRKYDVDKIPVQFQSSTTDPIASSDGAKPTLDQKDVEPKDENPAGEQKPESRRSDEPDYVRATIAKELDTPADSSEQKLEEDDETGPHVCTDIALEDLLNDFLEDETVPQNPSQVLFPTVSNEDDKLLLNSPLIESDRIDEAMLLAELNNILKDDKPPSLPDKVEELSEQPLFTYTIYEPCSSTAPINVTVNMNDSRPQPDPKPKRSNQPPKPRFRTEHGLAHAQPPPAKKRVARPPKDTPPSPPPKMSRGKRYESDEEYIPSFARTRRIQLRPRRGRRCAPRARAPAPTGYYLTELQLQPEPDKPEETMAPAPEEEQQQQQEPACQSPLAASDGVYMNMPSLEGSLAAKDAGGANFKMSDQAESSTEPAEEVQVIDGCHPDDGVDRREDDGSGSSRVRTISEGYGITEEQEKTLLAGEDGEDLDVIDCFVKDFDSDLEEEFLQKDAENVELVEKKASGTVTEFKADNIKVLKVVRIVRTPEESGNATEEHEEPLKGFEEEATAPDGDGEEEDEDVIQIVEENADDLLEETPAGAEMAEERPHVSVHVSDDTENERILSKPLVKQVVMDVSGEVGEEDELKDPDGGAGSPKSHADDRDEGSMGTQEDSDAEQPLVIADSVEANVETMSGWHQEDPDVLQLKLDLHQNMGEMDYEPDEDDHRDNRANEEEQIERRIQIKEEPKSPVKNRLERILLEVEDIPTIVLSSDDDFVDLMPQKKKKGKKKSKKKNRQRTKSECSVIEVITPITVEESLPAVKSSKSLYPNDSMTVDAELLKTGFRMELRKRKSATVLEENGTPPPTKRSGRSSTGQSKSRTNIISTESFKISEDIRQEKPPKKTFAQKSTFQPVSTADKLKINSLFKDCEKADEVPIRILNDGMPLFDEDSDNLFERAFEKPHQTVKKHVAAAPLSRQTMLIDALPRATVKNVHKPSNEQPSSSKSKLVPKIRQLEDDLAMTSSDDDSPLIKNQNSAKGVTGSPVPKKPGRKRGRAPKQHIEDYFSPSPGRKKDSTETQGKIGSKSQVKRRKKRSRISSCSSNSEEETVQSISLAGTSSTITTNRSVTISTEQEVEVDEQQAELPKTNELSVILSPLTKEQIDQRSKCITPKKVRALSKATQTQLEGLTWRIDLNQIDFHSEYFEKIYQLITIGREVRNLPRRNNSLEGVIIAGRNAVQPPNPPERSPQQQPAAAVNGRARSNIEQLLFERADEVECVATARVDPSARAQMVRSIRANFRIPKITKQPSRSPQDVTSSTHHDIEQQHYRVDEPRQPSSGGYSNDRLVAPEPRRHITVGDRSPLRVENSLNNAVVANRPVVSAPATAGNAARPLVPLRRTIRNDNVQSSMVAPHQPQLQPVENGYQAYRPQPEQVPAPQYQPVFQQQPQPQQFGAYMAPGQELDIKPNIAMALAAPQASMLAPVVMRNPYFDFMYQMNMMQILPQQMQFPAMNVAGQMFSGPSAVPTFASTTAATSNQIPATAPSLSAQMMPRPVGQQDEESEQISQIFGCIDHLKGRCIKNPCQYPHTLPSQGTLRQTLLGSTQEVVMTTYHFIVSQDDLFLRYFCVYTEVMGHRNMRHQLIDAVPHCEQNKRAFPYYGYIVTGLTITGTLSRSKAVQLVLEKHRKINFDQIHVLISLIVDTGDDVALFLPWLDEFSQVPGYHFEIPSINRLLKFCVRASRSPNAVPLHGTLANVAKLIFRLVMSVAAGKEPFVDTDTLIEYAELLMRSNLGLDHEKIMHKYGKNELSSSAVRH